MEKVLTEEDTEPEVAAIVEAARSLLQVVGSGLSDPQSVRGGNEA